MIIFCEECGERYIIEPEEIESAPMIFICRSCNEIIRISSQQSAPQNGSEEENQPSGKV